MKGLRTAAIAAFALAATVATSASATVFGITNVGAIAGPTDSIDWSQLGATFTSVTSPVVVTSGGGASVTVSSAGGDLQRRDQGDGWSGNFAPGTALLWDDGVGPDITLTFANPVAAVGAKIQADFFGPFTAQIVGSNGAVLGSFDEDGVASSAADDSTIFIGLQSTAIDISQIQFTLLSASNAPNDFAIGPVTFSTTPISAGIPEPATWAMMIVGFAMVGGALRGLILSDRRLAKLEDLSEA